ncbi:SAF domain-containing protein [Rhodoluna lacicola]|uniref:SAF domain-containing protein n=1 Tax=Rhodoluna lacicola TaxID=529884 RepID=UPI002232057D|nr:SAF domain-containing protein [Rhodoluna lacicola]
MAILLLTSSVLGVNAVIAANNQTSEYLVAGRDLPAGSPIALTDSATAQVNLGITAGNYLSVGDLPSGGYLLGPVRKGQLIPKSMLASAVIDERVPLVVSSAMGLSSGLIAGASVDIWVTPIDDENLVGEPYALVLGAEVARLLEKTEMFNNSGPDVELWVPVEAVGPVLGAMSSGSKLSLVLRPTLADE